MAQIYMQKKKKINPSILWPASVRSGMEKYWGSGTVGSETLRRSDRLQSNYKLQSQIEICSGSEHV